MVYFRNDCLLWLIYFINFVKCISSNTFRTKEEYNFTKAILSDSGRTYETNKLETYLTKLAVEEMLTSEPTKLRVKRQSGGGKYTDAAQMPQVKVLRLFLQMMKNLWAPVYVGGAHPFHHEVPKPVVQLFKDKIVKFFFPKVGEEAIKD